MNHNEAKVLIWIHKIYLFAEKTEKNHWLSSVFKPVLVTGPVVLNIVGL